MGFIQAVKEACPRRGLALGRCDLARGKAHGPQGAIGTQSPKKTTSEIIFNYWETNCYTKHVI